VKPTAPASPIRCEACRRPGTRMEMRVVHTEPMRLCVDPVDCRRHWST
jgi:hypothetical protein